MILNNETPEIVGMITHVEIIKHRDGRQIPQTFHMPAYVEYIQPAGNLIAEISCVALFHYAICARNSYELFEKDVIALEGDPDPVTDGPNYQQLFKSIARSYGVKPENMVKFWGHVDAQFIANDIPLLPAGSKYRFDQVLEVN